MSKAKALNAPVPIYPFHSRGTTDLEIQARHERGRGKEQPTRKYQRPQVQELWTREKRGALRARDTAKPDISNIDLLYLRPSGNNFNI